MNLKLLIAIAILVSAAKASLEKPRFKFSQNSKIMLSWEETWEVGSSNTLAFLNSDKRLNIKIVVEGNVGSGLRRILQFRCRQGENENIIDMETLKFNSNEKQCDATIPFSVSQKNSELGEFEFTLLSSNLPYWQAFSDKLELRVRVDHSTGSLVSNSLFVWNLDALSKLNPTPQSGDTYPRRFLTINAVEFLKKMEAAKDESFQSIQFLDSELSRMISSAPDFLKSKINVGAILNFDAGTCESYQISRASMFVNYHSKLDERNHNLLKHMYLDIEQGILYFSSYGLSSAISDFYNLKNPSQIGICTTLSFAGQGQPYDKTFSIAQKIPKSLASYRTFGRKSSECQVVSSVVNRQVKIFSGMDYTPLVCPILCSDPLQPYKFYHGDVALMPDINRDWNEVDGIRVSKTGNVIEFPPVLYKRHSGVYRCEAGGVRFNFDIQVISMPQFVSKSVGSLTSSVTDLSGNLPPTIYAMEGESLAYNCTTFFTDVHSTTINGVFFTTSGGNNKWRQLSIEDFNSLITPSHGWSQVVVPETSSKPESMTLKIEIDSVPPAVTSTNLNFTHRFMCNASVAKSDAERMGMPSYSVQSGSNVFFISRPIISNFDLTMAKNCSTQKCSAAQGAYFQFAIKPDIVAYLKAVGVSVTGYFKIDENYLVGKHILTDKGVSEITFDSSSMKLTFKVNPITRLDVLKEFQSRKILTPVYNFRYPEGAKMNNLFIKKDKHGSYNVAAGLIDCRNDPNCFYSTDFDAKTTLKDLSLALGFMGEPVPKADARTASTSMIVVILIAVVILLVIVVLLVYLLRRDTGQTYMLDAKERQQGNHPELEAKEEQFKEYQRPEEGPLKASRLSMNSSISAASKDDQELEEYGNDDIDCTKFVEDGSFIGDYSTDARKREAFNAHQV